MAFIPCACPRTVQILSKAIKTCEDAEEPLSLQQQDYLKMCLRDVSPAAQPMTQKISQYRSDIFYCFGRNHLLLSCLPGKGSPKVQAESVAAHIPCDCACWCACSICWGCCLLYAFASVFVRVSMRMHAGLCTYARVQFHGACKTLKVCFLQH